VSLKAGATLLRAILTYPSRRVPSFRRAAAPRSETASKGCLKVSLLELCQWIQDTQIGTGIRESIYVFPIIEGTHVLGLALSIGTVMWLDLRLLGIAMRRQSVSEVFGQLKPWMRIGFAVMFTTGGLLFWANAARCYPSTYFRIKIVLLLLSGVNVLVYHRTIDRRRSEWENGPIPLQARLAGLLSLILWTGVIAAGRIMAYTL